MGIILKIITWLKDNGAGLVGLLNSLVRIVRELIIVVLRILGLFMPRKFGEAIILKIGNRFDIVEALLRKLTDFLLKIGG